MCLDRHQNTKETLNYEYFDRHQNIKKEHALIVIRTKKGAHVTHVQYSDIT